MSSSEEEDEEDGEDAEEASEEQRSESPSVEAGDAEAETAAAEE